MKKSLTLIITLLLTGCGLGGKPQNEAQVLHYRCGTLPLTVTLTPQQAHLVMDGQPLTLQQEESAVGTSYSDGTYRLRTQGEGATIERSQRVIVNDCQREDAR